MGGGGVDALGGAAGEKAGDQVEPVDREIIEDDVADAVEGSAGDPVVVPVDGEMGTEDLADQAGADRLADVGEVRGPSGVLVDGEFYVLRAGEIDEVLTGVEIEHEGLLAKDVLVGIKGGFDDRDALDGMGGDVDDFNVVALEEIAIVG